MDIGTKIKKYRESQNISQDELALSDEFLGGGRG